MSKFSDLTNRKFGRLTVVSRAENDKRGNTRWVCICACGNEVTTKRNSLVSKRTHSCGCYKSERTRERHFKHGLKRHRLYTIWSHMKRRCYNNSTKYYSYYGGRGIDVCEEWRNDFLRFYYWAIENDYAKDLALDRIDNNKGYTPENCRWVDMTTQANNKRNNRHITYRGETKTLAQWARHLGICAAVLRQRLSRYGWAVEKAFTTPLQKRTQKKDTP